MPSRSGLTLSGQRQMEKDVQLARTVYENLCKVVRRLRLGSAKAAMSILRLKRMSTA